MQSFTSSFHSSMGRLPRARGRPTATSGSSFGHQPLDRSRRIGVKGTSSIRLTRLLLKLAQIKRSRWTKSRFTSIPIVKKRTNIRGDSRHGNICANTAHAAVVPIHNACKASRRLRGGCRIRCDLARKQYPGSMICRTDR